MINKIIHFSVYQRVPVLFLTALLMFVGWISFQSLPIDAVPDVTNNQVQINVPLDGLSTNEAERQVTFPIETAMRGIAGVTLVRSFTRSNLSQITIIFSDEVDLYRARQMVMERLQSISNNLPKNIDPKIGPITSGLGEIFHYTIETDRILEGSERLHQLMELKTLQDWFVKPRLRTVKGVAEVNTIGGYERQFHIQPNPTAMAKYGLQFTDLINALEKTNRSVGAGYVKQSGEQFLVQSTGLLKTSDDIRNILVKVLQNFQTITIADVAKVAIASELRTGAGLVDGHEAVIGTVMMLIGENSRTVAQNVQQRLEAIGKELPEGYHLRSLYNRSELVNFTLETLKHSLLTGAFLVIVILFLLIGNMRAAFITAVTIPVSLLMTFIFMQRFGISGNLMSLGALDFGIIVDGTVIVLDHCIRVIQERGKKLARALSKEEVKKAIYDATVEIRTAAGFGELIIVVVFLPIFSFENVEGKTFHPMAATFIIALLSALALSFTATPALASLFLNGNAADHEPWIMKKIEHYYAPILATLLRYKRQVMQVGLIATISGVLLFKTLGGEFLPQLDEGSLMIECVRSVRISLDQSIELQAITEKTLAEFPEVEFTFSKIGTAEIANDPQNVNQGDAYVVLKPHSDWPLIQGKRRTKQELTLAMIERLKKAVPEQSVMPNQPIQNRFNDLLEGSRGDIAVKVFGEDLEVLQTITTQIKDQLQNIRGAGEIGTELRGKSKLLKIAPKEEVLRRLGISNGYVLDTVAIALGGYDAGYIYDGFKRFPIMVRLDENDRSDLELVRRLPVGFSVGGTLPLEEMTTIEFEEVFAEIRREEGSRRSVVMLSTRDRDVESFVHEAQSVIEKEIKLPPGYSIKWGGSFENLQKARVRLMLTVPIALCLVFFMIFTAFKNIIQALLIFLCVPLALVGGVLGLILNHLNFSVSAGVGFIALSGIAVLNGVVLINYFNELHKEGLAGNALIKKGTLLRLRPVLMTALVDIFGFLPMMLSTGMGSEVQKPLASVVVGGVISSTLLTLIVLPVVYSVLEKRIIQAAHASKKKSSH